MARRRRITWPRRGEVYLVGLDPTVGAEIQKTRPALIIQNDIANRYSPIIIVAAITSHFKEPLYPTEVPISRPEGGLKVDSVVLMNQVRSIDKRRLMRRLGKVKASTLSAVDDAITLSLGLVEL